MNIRIAPRTRNNNQIENPIKAVFIGMLPSTPNFIRTKAITANTYR